MEKGHVLLKFIIIGDSGTGKSCILHRFTDNEFSNDQAQTIGVEFGAKIVNVMGKKVKLQIWDTAGQERYQSVTRSYYRGAAGCLLVYDVTRKSTFEHVTSWLVEAKKLADQNVVVMLVGNKADLAARREVAYTEASLFAQQQGILSIEVSACTGDNVEAAFLAVAKGAVQGKIDRDAAGAGGAGAKPGLLGSEDTSASKCSC